MHSIYTIAMLVVMFYHHCVYYTYTIYIFFLTYFCCFYFYVQFACASILWICNGFAFFFYLIFNYFSTYILMWSAILKIELLNFWFFSLISKFIKLEFSTEKIFSATLSIQKKKKIVVFCFYLFLFSCYTRFYRPCPYSQSLLSLQSMCSLLHTAMVLSMYWSRAHYN